MTPPTPSSRASAAAPTVLRATSPGDLLAYVPVVFGFHPTDSVAMLSLGSGAPCHARIDLPVDLDEVRAVTRHLTDAARRNRADRVAVIVYTDQASAARRVVERLATRLARAGIDLVCAVRADGSRWWTLRDAGRGEEGPGTPYDLRTHPFTAQSVLDGTVVLGSRDDLAATLRGDPAEQAHLGRTADDAADRLVDAVRARGARAALVEEGRWAQQRVRAFLADPQPLDDADAARLAVAVLTSIEVRDVAWAELDQDTAAAHVQLWRDLVRRLPEELRAPPAGLLAFAAWQAGHGALAWCAVDVCQAADPDHGLAGLVAQALAGALPPSAWTPLDASVLTLFRPRPEP
jgi:hypothetical protein